MTSQLAAPSVSLLRGSQEPRIFSAPPYFASTGPEAIDLASLAGLVLDEWQQTVLTAALGEKRDGRWAAFEVGLVVPRQNGKNGLLEARQLAGLFLLEEGLLIHSAHMADTSVEQFLRLATLIEGTPELSRRVKKMTRGKGTESIQLHRNAKTGRAPRLTFRTRTGGGGRGFSCDLLTFDEAMILPEAFHGALMPTLSARPNPQVLYTGSAVDQEVHEDGIVLARVRERGVKGGDPSLVYAEWSAEAERPDAVTAEKAVDRHVWAQANPALGIRIAEEHIEREQRTMSARTFAVERLNVGDWPRTDGLVECVIAPEQWLAVQDLDSQFTGAPCFSIDVAPDRSWASIGAAGQREDNRAHIEVIEHRRGTGWIVERAVELERKHNPVAFVMDGAGAVASLVPALTDALRVEPTLLSGREHTQACGLFFDLVTQDGLRHIANPELDAAVAAAVKRELLGAWAWSRRNSGVDISPLVAVTLALWGMRTLSHSSAEVVDVAGVYEEMLKRGDL